MLKMGFAQSPSLGYCSLPVITVFDLNPTFNLPPSSVKHQNCLQCCEIYCHKSALGGLMIYIFNIFLSSCPLQV